MAYLWLSLAIKNGQADAVKALDNLAKQMTATDIAIAQCNLANHYIDGAGVQQNYPEAIRLYREAAAQGIREAYYNLGIIYENGMGVKKDNDEAARFYMKAMNAGYDGALERLLPLLALEGIAVENPKLQHENNKQDSVSYISVNKTTDLSVKDRVIEKGAKGMIAGGVFATLLFLIATVSRYMKRVFPRYKKATANAIHKTASNTVHVVQELRKSEGERLSDLDDQFFGVVAEEMSNGDVKQDLWTKAFMIADGEESKQKASYIRLRVKQLSVIDKANH